MKHLFAILFLCLLVSSGSVQGRDHDTEADHSTAPKNPSKSYLGSTGIYDGEYRYGKPHGQGTFTFSSGSKYVGGFKRGKMHGQGTFTYGDRGKYAGFWMNPVDYIVERFPHGTMYSGDWKKGKYDGQGTITFPDGSMYVGTFKDGEYHDHGTFTNADGRKFVGEFKYGVYLGQDTILSPAYYSFFGTLRPVAESIVIKIRPGHQWTCSLESAVIINGKPQESEIQTVFMSTYKDDSGIKWYTEQVIEALKMGIVIDVGQHGTEIKDIAGESVQAGSLGFKHQKLAQSITEPFLKHLAGYVGSYIGKPIQQHIVIRFAPDLYVRIIELGLGFDLDSLDVTSLGTSFWKAVVLGETTIDNSRNLVLGHAGNFDMGLSSVDGIDFYFKVSYLSYQFVDLDSGLATDFQGKTTGLVIVKPQNRKVKVKLVSKQLCKK